MFHGGSQQRRDLVAKHNLPADLLKRRDQRIIVRQKRVRESKIVHLLLPPRPDLEQPDILLDDRTPVEIAAPVEENFSRAMEWKNQVAAIFVRGEQADVLGKQGQLVRGQHRELIRRKTRV